MVNNKNVSRYSGSLPESVATNRKIAGGPIYGPDEVLALLDETGSGCIRAWTRGCIEDLQKYSMDLDDVEELIRLCFRSGRYIDSEWCQQKTDGPWAACDSYQVTQRKWVNYAHKEMDFENYIKFAIGKTGQLMLLISCHPSEIRW
jgi:hypothetical protein